VRNYFAAQPSFVPIAQPHGSNAERNVVANLGTRSSRSRHTTTLTICVGARYKFTSRFCTTASHQPGPKPKCRPRCLTPDNEPSLPTQRFPTGNELTPSDDSTKPQPKSGPTIINIPATKRRSESYGNRTATHKNCGANIRSSQPFKPSWRILLRRRGRRCPSAPSARIHFF
jgi:hypothetical protein